MATFVPRKPEKDIISMRISLDLLEKVDAIAEKTGISRNELLNQCIAYALNNMYENE
ncbi:ribbon-helix-helix CopG family protein [Hydrogenoanaerobacterium saccharovorans]|uniref:Ribbon-helix-helix protein, copG family n=1 Tax=Hydrogenoanaerobacterium saccharovorans TaxID=474960 RepID=A0A1H8CIV3_9FIRM|nr:ribbon-helix-helix protein, CopG family [Hydrogenoanaerobacterium saccharovorans]RPF43088.1 ribbon-helix-helix CopG family protein [Hydrogenoanaerobacterium saccharovorans]SEM94017.1 Ribbon-helix-helix protein, copG family [Hydrogenoanaerobacterium saccharovorans]